LSLTLVDWCWRMEALIAVVSWYVLVGSGPVIRALPTPRVGVLERRGVVLAIGVVGRHFDFKVASLSWG
jgi:hypothetical protein